MKTMQTERLLLRRWEESDAEDLFRYARDPDVGPVCGWPPHQDVEESLSVIRNVLSGPECYAVCLKEDRKAIGCIELRLNGRTDMTDRDDECELGYWLGKPFWGRGVMPEAAKEIIRHAFEDLGMEKVWCGYYDGNLKSRRCQEKCGFRYQWTTEGLDVPKMHETRTGHVNLLTKEAWTVRNSLLRFDNHDLRIPYYELMLERDLNDIPETALPEGYHFENFRPGDRDVWIALEKTAKEFTTFEEGEDAWQRYYAGHEKELEDRMFFVADQGGQKLATATAYYDIRTGDDGRTGWLHWVAVRRDHQGLGLSKPLITHVLQYMKSLGYRRAVVPTQTTTWLACKVYLDLGLRPIPRNAERNRAGWRIVKTLTGHPALREFEPVPEDELTAKPGE